MRIRKDSKPYKILRQILIAGGFLTLATISPVGGAKLTQDLIKLYFRKKRFERERFLRDLKRLQMRELLDYKELSNGNIQLMLSKAGKHFELKYNFENIKLNRSKRWDGQWRMIIFDIPDTQKQARDAFRQKLRQLGFYPVQKSVFITPYECEKEIDFICSIFDIRRYILIFYINRFEGEKKLRHYFKI